MSNNMMNRSILVLSLSVFLSACAGDDDPVPPRTAEGVFKDSNVEGVIFVSGDQVGVTDADGRFTYEVGQTVSFSVGGVDLGTVPGSDLVTPVDLVDGGSSDSVAVQNIVRFLMMLDLDGDPSNGITISDAVQAIANDFDAVDFAADDLGAELALIIAAVEAADGVDHVLPGAAAAKSHVESTLRCVRSGLYLGSFSGTDQGTFGLIIDASTGLARGFAFTDGELLTLTGTTAVSSDQDGGFVSGSASSGATFQGMFSSSDGLEGTWANEITGGSGSFSGSREAGMSDSQYRLSGSFAGDGVGLFALDIDESGGVTGVAYSPEDDELLDLTGTFSEGTISASGQDGTELTGTFNVMTGAVSGTWTFTAEDEGGSWTGAGCGLN